MRIITFDLIRIKECQFDSGFSQKFLKINFASLRKKNYTVGIGLLEEVSLKNKEELQLSILSSYNINLI